MIERVASSFNEHFLESFFFGGGSLAVIKPDLSRNLVKPATAENYPASHN